MKKTYEKPSLVSVSLESQEHLLAASPTSSQMDGSEKWDQDDVNDDMKQADANVLNW